MGPAPKRILNQGSKLLAPRLGLIRIAARLSQSLAACEVRRNNGLLFFDRWVIYENHAT